MNELKYNLLKEISLTNNWYILIPEICVALLAILILSVDLFRKSSQKDKATRNYFDISKLIAVGGQFLILFILVFLGDHFFDPSISHFGGLIKQDDYTQFMRIFFIISSLGITIISEYYFRNKEIPQAEYFHILILICAGFMLLVQSSHFIAFFVNLELVTIGFYVLIAFQRTNTKSLEASLKYLTLGALSSVILLFGVVLLYGISGNPEMPGNTSNGFNFSELQAFIGLNPENLVVRLGALFVIAGIAFKVGLVPFHIWVPDVYQGAPTPTMGYLAISSKAAGIFVLFQLLQGPFYPLADFLIPLLSILAAISILYANIAATGQKKIKRLIGLSGISHAGYLLIGIISSILAFDAIHVILFYLSVYMISSLLLFGCLIFLNENENNQIEIKDFQAIYKRNYLLGIASSIALASLAGIPPLAGFISKLLLVIVAFQSKLYGLIIVALIGVVISIYYYFGWMRSIFYNDNNTSNIIEFDISFSQKIYLMILTFIVVAIGLYPKLLIQII